MDRVLLSVLITSLLQSVAASSVASCNNKSDGRIQVLFVAAGEVEEDYQAEASGDGMERGGMKKFLKEESGHSFRQQMSRNQKLERAVRLAADIINNDSSTCHLDGNRLDIAVRYSKCDRQAALEVFYESLFAPSSPSNVAIIGAGCSLSTVAMAEVSQYYNLPLISYSSSTLSLDDRERFPYLSRTLPSDLWVAASMVTIIQHFNWTRAAIITQDTTAFRTLSAKLSEKLLGANITIIDHILLPTDPAMITADALFPPEVRIILVNTDSSMARRVFCQAYHSLNWQEYRYVWLTQGWYGDQWWVESEEEEGNCSHAQILEFLRQQRVLGVSHYPSTDFSLSGSYDFISRAALRNVTTSFTESSEYLAFDAVWAVVQALDQLDSSDYMNFDPLDVTNASNREAGGRIRDSLQTLTFQGATGEVRIRNGSRDVDVIRVLQYSREATGESGRQLVATIPVEDGTLQDIDLMQNHLWPNQSVPSDGTPYTVERYPYLWMVVTSNAFACLNIVAAIVCLVFNFIFRNRKLIRLTSPNLNYVIGLGVIVFSISVFFFAYPPFSHSVLNGYCGVRSWFAGIGYTLCFGTINTKMWRVYYIFHNPKPTAKKKPLKDVHLLLFVLLFLLVDVIILTISTSIDTVRLEAVQIPDKEHSSEPDDEGITVHYEVTLCDSRYKTLWLGILLGYKVIIQGVGVFLAFKIRKVKIKVLNDSREVTATLYLTSLILATVIIITLIFDDYLNVYTAGYAYGIPLSSSVVLAVVFLSKMVRLYKDPKGDLLFTHVTRDAGASCAAAVTGDEHQIITLQRRLKHLEAQLTNFENENGDGNHGSLSLPTPTPATMTTTTEATSNGKHVQIILTNTQQDSTS